MNASRLLGLGFATGISLAALEVSANHIAYAKPMPLTDLNCIRIKGDNFASNFSGTKEDIILNREIYTSLLRFGSSSDQEFACKLPSAKSASLDLEMAIPSDAGGPFLLSIYLNGNQIISEKVFPGKVTLVNQPLTGRADVSYQVGGRRTIVFETTCLNGSSCSPIRFLKGNLNVVVNPGAKE
jgi:hypothetical protein